ncbi:hypothetical protein WOLCODRAFT_108951 [Wolfiporia cocos MD-104 SS10]|uniref:F-box domain-containing protein n=1 Tax=Wolfiporia cocos (strain MD-104) TaxID=742152 RepID=A0A2H3J393_WOLCO|nr:hypothetical protein WOLCODRAFT_108951 [Wolfiporia cocos MD-104 SS10]
MNPFDAVPVELIIRILRDLPLQSICALRLTSRFWNSLIEANESAVYQAAAVQHGFVRAEEERLSDVVLTKEIRFIHHVESWKELCHMYFQLHRNWAGQGLVTTDTYLESQRDVHRLKVDEDRGLLITTHGNGGLNVVDMQTGERLWGLPKSYVRKYAHLEYEDGFMIFDRYDGHKEVWRHAEEFDLFPLPTTNRPDNSQRAASVIPRGERVRRGRFKPWALFVIPETTFVYRFAYPTLAAASEMNIFLWDVPSATLVQTIPNLGQPQGDGGALGDVLYIDVSEEHVFLCGGQETWIFRRADNSLILRVPATETLSSRWKVCLEPTGFKSFGELVVPMRVHTVNSNGPLKPPKLPLLAIHVSRSGRDIAALTVDNRLVILRDFERVAKGQVTYADAALEIRLAPFSISSPRAESIYLAFECGRVSAVTTSGVYIITLDAAGCGLFDPEVHQRGHNTTLGIIDGYASFPQEISFAHLAASYIPFFSEREALASVSCLQLTATRLYMTWDRHHLPPRNSTRRTYDYGVDSAAQTTNRSRGAVNVGRAGNTRSNSRRAAPSLVWDDFAYDGGDYDYDYDYDEEEEDEEENDDDDDDDEEEEEEEVLGNDDHDEWGDLNNPDLPMLFALLMHAKTNGHVVCCIDFNPYE